VTFCRAVPRPCFAGLVCSRLRCGEASTPAAFSSARAALVSFLATGGTFAAVVVLDDVVVVVVTAGAAFARGVTRLFVTVCCDSVTVCDSTLVALGLRPGFFLGAGSGAGDADCELCLDAGCEDSVAAAAAVRRVLRRVVVDIVLRMRLARAMRSSSSGDVQGSCDVIGNNQ
jgi:hypothetical protein